MKKAQRRMVISAIVFVVYSAISGIISANLPGQTVAQAVAANHEVSVQCRNAKAADMGLMDRAAACTPEPLRHASNWLLLGQLLLGTVMLACIAADANKQS